MYAYDTRALRSIHAYIGTPYADTYQPHDPVSHLIDTFPHAHCPSNPTPQDEMQAAVLSGANTIRPYLVLRIDRDDVVNSAIHCLALYEVCRSVWRHCVCVCVAERKGPD